MLVIVVNYKNGTKNEASLDIYLRKYICNFYDCNLY